MNTPRSTAKVQRPLFDDPKTVRVTVPVTPEVLAAFQRLAATSGMSVGKAMGEWLSDTVDGVTTMVDLLEKARSAPKIAARELHAYALGLTDITSGLIEEVRQASKKPKKDEPGDAEGTRLRGAAAARGSARKSAAPLTPPVGNTGGKVPKKGKKAGDT